jgi:hypothetical protein
MGDISTLHEQQYRFSDVVEASGTTPKSLRRWFATLEIAPEKGWHAFSALEVFRFGIMRDLVDWGASVPKAYEIANECVDRIVTLMASLPPHPGREVYGDKRVADSWELIFGLSGRTMLLAGTGDSATAIYSATSGIADSGWSTELPGGRRSEQSMPSLLGFAFRSFLTLDLHGIAFWTMERLGRIAPEQEPS